MSTIFLIVFVLKIQLFSIIATEHIVVSQVTIGWAWQEQHQRWNNKKRKSLNGEEEKNSTKNINFMVESRQDFLADINYSDMFVIQLSHGVCLPRCLLLFIHIYWLNWNSILFSSFCIQYRWNTCRSQLFRKFLSLNLPLAYIPVSWCHPLETTSNGQLTLTGNVVWLVRNLICHNVHTVFNWTISLILISSTCNLIESFSFATLCVLYTAKPTN